MRKTSKDQAGKVAEATQTVNNVRARLESIRPTLPATASRIAEFIVANAGDVIHMSITELAKATDASEGSIVGLCQQIGASGFQQLKIALAQELVQPVQFIHEDLKKKDDAKTVIEKIIHSDIQALKDTLSVLDPSAMERAVRIILAADRVELYGIGSAAPIAEDAHYRMLRIGINCKVVVDSHMQAVSASLTNPNVATITVSHSGSTLETIEATRLAKEAGARTICITNFGKSPIQAYTDVVLHTMAKETRFRTEAMTSRIAQLAIVDTLIACLALATYDSAVKTIRQTFDVLSSKRY